MIEFKDVQFIRGDRHILKDVEFRMESGEHWVILGRNGSGKTTILEMMNAYLFPSSGEVWMLGERYGTVDVREARRRIGYTSQSLMDKLTYRDPVWEVVATGQYAYLRLYEETGPELKQRALQCLRELRAEHLAEQPIGVLSQGERKKAMLARSLMMEPAVMIMDEPCSGLDLYERELLLADLERIAGMGIQLVYVTHHIEEIMPVFTHVLLLHEGRVVSAGKKEDVLTRETIMQAYGVPVEVEWDHGRPWIRVVRSSS